jgi:Ni/Fe-hydrogenase subunit HybB-like protein
MAGNGRVSGVPGSGAESLRADGANAGAADALVRPLPLYTPSWQETGTFLAVVAYGVLVYSFSFRYFQLFPQERELKMELPQSGRT